MPLHFALLDQETPTHEFDCEEEELNSFLKSFALLFQDRHFGITIICSENPKKKIIGYYTLCPACIQRELLPEKFITGPKPNPIPAFRLCRLAIDKQYQGKGYGKILLIHALKKCLTQAKQIGGSVLIIDAKHEKAKQFYEHFGFLPLPSNSRVLIQKIKYLQHHLE